MVSVKKAVLEAIGEYNRYRSPEVVAKLIEFREDSFVVEFRGSFCLTCGYYDYFDDLVFILEDRGVKARIKSIEEIEDGAVVEFRLLREGEEVDPSERVMPERLVIIFDQLR